MYRELLELLAADRIIQLVGSDKIEEMVARHASIHALLSGGAGVTAPALPKTPSMPLPPSAAPSKPVTTAASGYLAQLLTTEGTASAGYQPVSPGTGSAQLHIGRHNLIFSRPQPGGAFKEELIGTAHVSILDPTDNPVRWRERFVVTDLAAWLDGGFEIKYDTSTPPTWDAATSEKEAIASFSNTLSSGSGVRWSMQMTYRYTNPLDTDEVTTLLAAANASTDVPSRSLFDVMASGVAGIGDGPRQAGLLLREVFGPATSPSLIVEHWRLQDDWKPVTKDENNTLSLKPRATGKDTLKQFFDESRKYSDKQADAKQPRGWYVRGAYKVSKTILP